MMVPFLSFTKSAIAVRRVASSLRCQSVSSTCLTLVPVIFATSCSCNPLCTLLVIAKCLKLQGQARFYRAPGLSPEELNALLRTVITRVTRKLVRAGVRVAEDEQPTLTCSWTPL